MHPIPAGLVVDEIHGRAKITALDTVVISDRKTRKKIKKVKAKNIIIATGSSPIRLQQAKIEDDYIIDSAPPFEALVIQ